MERQNKTQTEILSAKVMKLEMVLMLLLHVMSKLEPNSKILAQAEHILSHGD